MTVEVRIPSMLQKFTNGEKLLSYNDRATVGDLLSSIDADHPGIGHQLFEDGELRRFVNIFLNDEDIRFIKQMDTELNDGDVLAILPALAGGS